MNSTRNLSLIITAVVFTFLLLLPVAILPNCPKGLKNDPFPGRCGLWEDANQDQICDLSQPEQTTLTPQRQFNPAFGWQSGVFLLILATSVVLMLKTKQLTYRYLILASSLIFGFFTFRALCPISFFQFLVILKDRAVLSIFPFLVFLATIITTLIFGRIFCGWACPIGAFQELIFRLPKWLGLKIPRLTKKIPRFLRLTPILVLILTGFWVIRSGQTAFCQLDPFAWLFGLSTSAFLLAGLVLVMIISLFVFRPFCLLVCPLSPVFQTLASLSFYQIKKNKKKCNQCKLCYQLCPTQAIDKKLKVDSKECYCCQDCLLACPKKALSYQAQ